MFISVLVTVTAVLAPVPPDPPLEPHFRELQGEWRVVSAECTRGAWSRKEVAEITVEVVRDTLVYRENGHTEKFRITLDTAQRPRWINFSQIVAGVESKLPCHAIYDVNGNHMKLCLGSVFTPNNPEDRPRELAVGPERPPCGRMLLVLTRVKK